MNFEKLTNQLQKSIGNAQSIALGQDHTLIEPCHVLLAMLDNMEGGTSAIFEKAGFKVSEIKLKLNDEIISQENLIISYELFRQNYLKLSVGKKRHFKIELS